MKNFNGGKAFQLQPRIQIFQSLQHLEVIAERQRRMQTADDMQFRDAELQRLARFFDNLRHGQLEAIGVALLARE